MPKYLATANNRPVTGIHLFLLAVWLHSVCFATCVNGRDEWQLYPPGRQAFCNSITGTTMQFFATGIPVSHSLSAGYWSDKLALKPYREFLSIGKKGQWQRLAVQLLSESFGIAGTSAEETSRRITDAVNGGISIYGTSTLTMLDVVLHGITVDVGTTLDIGTDIPEAPFLLLFSEDKGLRSGTTLPLTHMGTKVRLCTDATFMYAHPFDLSLFGEKIDAFLSDVADLQHAAWNGGLTIVFGHAFIGMNTTDGGIHLSEDGSQLYVDTRTELITSGIAIQGAWVPNIALQKGFPVTGMGAGINAGVVLYGKKTMFGIELSRVGPMFWNDVREATFTLRTRNMTAADLFSKEFTLFDTLRGGSLPDLDTGALLQSAPHLWCLLPARLTVGYSYRTDFSSLHSTIIHALSAYLQTSLEYAQDLAPWPGYSYIPRFTIATECGFWRGTVPVSVGCSLGGAKAVTSSLAIGGRFGRFALQGGYEAVGTPYLYPRRGCAVFFGVSSGWGRGRSTSPYNK